MAPTRHLAAILAADVAGYSRLMGIDEEGTYNRIQAHFQELLSPTIREHQGRTVKSTGDGVLAEFVSVIDAMRCAVNVQRGMLDREPDVTADQRIRFRVGVNLGDVIAENDDIFGDGVNVAARLEALAEPGGICVSRTVRDQIRDRLPYPLEDGGEHHVKNIARPLRVYTLSADAIANLPVPSRPLAADPLPPLAAPRLSIAVMPFANLSDDPEQQYFADGVTEDLTTDLSRISDMLVISRNSAFAYKDKGISTRQIGGELGVRYILQGSVRRSATRLRVAAQLIDTQTDGHLWAERFDRDAGDLFALQDEITACIAVALNSALITAEANRAVGRPDALDYILRGRAVWSKTRTREHAAEAISLLERALDLDPEGATMAPSYMASMLAGRVLDNQSETATEDLLRADELVTRALAQRPNDAYTHYAKGNLLRARHRYIEAVEEYEITLKLNRNLVGAYAHIGRCKLFTGEVQEVIARHEQAMRLSPRDPDMHLWFNRIGQAHLVQLQLDEALLWFEKARNANPRYPGTHGSLAAIYALKEDTNRAAAELAEARRLSGDDRFSSIAKLQVAGFLAVPTIRALFEPTLFAGLRRAGMPEE